MTEVKMYMADDGKTFATQEECANYENENKKIKSFKRTLLAIKDYCEARPDCDNCPFKSSANCLLNNFPSAWRIERED